METIVAPYWPENNDPPTLLRVSFDNLQGRLPDWLTRRITLQPVIDNSSGAWRDLANGKNQTRFIRKVELERRK
jgi:hypothetical protein